MNWWQNLGPTERMMLAIGLPVVGIVVLVQLARGRRAADGEEGASSTAVPSGVPVGEGQFVPPVDLGLTSQLAAFEDNFTGAFLALGDRLEDLILLPPPNDEAPSPSFIASPANFILQQPPASSAPVEIVASPGWLPTSVATAGAAPRGVSPSALVNAINAASSSPPSAPSTPTLPPDARRNWTPPSPRYATPNGGTRRAFTRPTRPTATYH